VVLAKNNGAREEECLVGRSTLHSVTPGRTKPRNKKGGAAHCRCPSKDWPDMKAASGGTLTTSAPEAGLPIPSPYCFVWRGRAGGLGGLGLKTCSAGHCGQGPRWRPGSGTLHLNGANEREGKRKKKNNASMMANDNIFFLNVTTFTVGMLQK